MYRSATEHYEEIFGYLPPKKISVQKLPIFDDFTTQCNFEGQYLRQGTWYRQSGNGVGNYEGSPMSSQDFTNFGLQTAKNRSVVSSSLWNHHLLYGVGHHIGLPLGVPKFIVLLVSIPFVFMFLFLSVCLSTLLVITFCINIDDQLRWIIPSDSLPLPYYYLYCICIVTYCG